jgi:hypothetical protein
VDLVDKELEEAQEALAQAEAAVRAGGKAPDPKERLDATILAQVREILSTAPTTSALQVADRVGISRNTAQKYTRLIKEELALEAAEAEENPTRAKLLKDVRRNRLLVERYCARLLAQAETNRGNVEGVSKVLPILERFFRLEAELMDPDKMSDGAGGKKPTGDAFLLMVQQFMLGSSPGADPPLPPDMLAEYKRVKAERIREGRAVDPASSVVVDVEPEPAAAPPEEVPE